MIDGLSIVANEQLVLSLLNRRRNVFESDYARSFDDIRLQVAGSRILVLGAAGSIGRSVARKIFALEPRALIVVDVNENGLADFVRDIRSSFHKPSTELSAICFDPLSGKADEFVNRYGPFDTILNFAAMKHVRSEKDPFTLSRMLAVNLRLMRLLVEWTELAEASALFSVSSDKAANPVSIMGASKRIMEIIGIALGNGRFSTARFANVAFSSGSLPKSFLDRLSRNQPISAPSNIRRFFITHDEAANLCLLSAFVAQRDSIAVPKVPEELQLTSFVEIAQNVLSLRDLRPILCRSEDEARSMEATQSGWPCYFFQSDTTGEKLFEEFVADGEIEIPSRLKRFASFGILSLRVKRSSTLLLIWTQLSRRRRRSSPDFRMSFRNLAI